MIGRRKSTTGKENVKHWVQKSSKKNVQTTNKGSKERSEAGTKGNTQGDSGEHARIQKEKRR